ncbi:ribonuclease III domain-containing protein [Flammula alnicola]|nr:ribonuclease III domain-containing protein [Flammula alnicola]
MLFAFPRGPQPLFIAHRLLSPQPSRPSSLPRVNLTNLRFISSFAGPLDMTISLKPDFGKDGSLFPPLPEILSPAIFQQVFTHRSFYARPTHVFEDHPDDLSPDNEKFEHLGDTVLGLTITSLLIDLFPGLRVGPSTKIRAMIVGNPTLAEISVRYRLPESLRLHPAQAITLRASTNIQADVFEAFIGGLYLDQGLEAVRKWINILFPPYAMAAYDIARQQHGLPPMPPSVQLVRPFNNLNPKVNMGQGGSPGPHPEPSELMNMPTIGHLALFNQHLQKTNRQVEWIYSGGSEQSDATGYSDVGLPPEVLIKGTKATPVWYVKVMVDGDFYGRGRGIRRRQQETRRRRRV